MSTVERVDFWADIAALVLIALHIAGIGIFGWRARRRRISTVTIGAATTSMVIGLGAALAAAVLGGYAAFLVLAQLHIPVLAQFGIQLSVAFLCAWWTSRLYGRWLSQPIFRWFSGEGVTQDG